MKAKEPNSPDQMEQLLIDIGIDVISVNKVSIKFWFKGNEIEYFIKKQWVTGKGIKDGRGWNHMYNQLNNK